MEDNNMKRVQIPAFGSWDYCDEMPITHYFESAMQAGFNIRGHFFAEGADLFKLPPAPLKPTYHRNVKRGKEEKQQKVKVYDLTTQSPKKPKAVDEDLYKIPPELLCQKPKRKRLLRNLWSGCIGFNCVSNC